MADQQKIDVIGIGSTGNGKATSFLETGNNFSLLLGLDWNMKMTLSSPKYMPKALD